MSSPAMLFKNNEMAMRECDKDWKAKSEIQSTWEKKYILQFKPVDSIYTSIMKFKYIEDYEKLKKIDKMLYELLHKLNYTKVKRFSSPKLINFIYELEEETNNLLKMVEKSIFFPNVDFDDGRVFVKKFRNIYIFRADRGNIYFMISKLISEMLLTPNDGFLYYLCDILEKKIQPTLDKVFKELRRRGIRNYQKQ